MAGLKFRVLLDSDGDSEVFRDILIADTDNFESFFKAIVTSFQFSGKEMASFYVSNDHWDKGQEISLMDLSYGEELMEEAPVVMKNAIIREFLEEPDQKFILVYDFMRMWIFLIELIGYEKEMTGAPVVLLSVGAAPPEDSKSIADQEDLFMGALDEEDDFGFDEFEDGLDSEDFPDEDEYTY